MDAIAILFTEPNHLLTQDVFNCLLNYAKQKDKFIAKFYVLRLLNRNGQQEVNGPQSTHTASVHKSVSKSAHKLYQQYRQSLEDPVVRKDTWREINNWLESVPNDRPDKLVVNAAKRAWADYERLHFTEKGSQVTMHDIIICFWKAIHDPENGELAETKDGKERLLEALYENQRTYNLDEQGKDNMQKDDPGCISGQFNKFLEKMHSLHPAVNLRIVNPETAYNKLPDLVKNHARQYLIKHPEMLDAVYNDQSVGPIWQSIKEQVQKAMDDEFKNDLPPAKMKEIVSQGVYVMLDKSYLDTIQQQISPNGQAHTQTVSPAQSLPFFNFNGQGNEHCQRQSRQNTTNG